METLTNKVVATQQMSMFDAQKQAEDRRREMENTRAQANLQPALVHAEVDVQIAEQQKRRSITLAEGQGQATRFEQEGIAAGIVAVGKAEGERVRAVGNATAEAYSLQAASVGQAPLAMIEIMKRIADGHVKITPDILITGEGGKGGDAGSGGGSGIMAAFVANLLAGSVKPASSNEDRPPRA
jgi:hypothetical protein